VAQGVPLFFLQVASSSCSSRYWGVWWSACIAAGGVPADVNLPATSPRPPPPQNPPPSLQKPESWRLACQTLVGDGTNSGQVTLVTKPQGK
jgi:hypothetical protein